MELLLFVKLREFHGLGAETLVDLGLRVKMLKTAHGEPLTAFRARETGAGGLASPPTADFARNQMAALGPIPVVLEALAGGALTAQLRPSKPRPAMTASGPTPVIGARGTKTTLGRDQ